MFVDVTAEFRLLVQDLRSRPGDLGFVIAERDKSRILGTSSSLSRQVESIVRTVRSLAELLNDHKHSYIENHAVAGAGTMTEAERNQVRP